MIKNRIKNILEDLEMFEDDIDKYEYIVDLGKALPPLDSVLHKDEFLVQGCTSKVWLICQKENETLHFSADSNSVIVKGLISILISIFQDLNPLDILAFDTNELSSLGLTEIISPTRQNGVYHMVKKIEHYALLYKD